MYICIYVYTYFVGGIPDPRIRIPLLVTATFAIGGHTERPIISSSSSSINIIIMSSNIIIMVIIMNISIPPPP